MENITSQATAITTGISLIGLWVIGAILYRDYRIDQFRQQMFDLRNQLFDDALAGRIPFDHPAYGLIRSTMNGFIRFGHQLDVVNIVAILLVVGPRPRGGAMFQEVWARNTKNLDSDTILMMEEYRLKMNEIVGKQFIASSPLFFVAIIPPVLVILLLAYAVYRMMSAKLFEQLDTAAMNEGDLHEQAA